MSSISSANPPDVVMTPSLRADIAGEPGQIAQLLQNTSSCSDAG
jgi:hypothetical protein